MHSNVLSVLVADATQAQMFQGNSVDGFVLTQSIAPDDTHHAAAPHADPKDSSADKFAHQLSHLLNAEIQAKAESSFVIVAAPHFLGVLRKTLGAQVEKHVTRSIDKDLLSLGADQLLERLRTELVDPPAPS